MSVHLVIKEKDVEKFRGMLISAWEEHIQETHIKEQVFQQVRSDSCSFVRWF